MKKKKKGNSAVNLCVRPACLFTSAFALVFCACVAAREYVPYKTKSNHTKQKGRLDKQDFSHYNRSFFLVICAPSSTPPPPPSSSKLDLGQLKLSMRRETREGNHIPNIL